MYQKEKNYLICNFQKKEMMSNDFVIEMPQHKRQESPNKTEPDHVQLVEHEQSWLKSFKTVPVKKQSE